MTQLFDLLHQGFREVQKLQTDREKEKQAPPFRTFETFLKATLSPQHFAGGVQFSSAAWNDSLRAHEKWFHYVPVRTPNQFTGRIDFSKANTYLSQGIKGGGKTQINNNASARFPKIVTIHTAGDDEVLADLRMFDFRNDPRVPRDIQEKIGQLERRLIVGPPNVDVVSSYDYVSYDKLELNDIETHDIIVAPSKIHKTDRTYLQCGETIIDILRRRNAKSDEKGEIFLKVLEAADIVYSRIVLKGMHAEQAKAHLIFLMRKMRHHGVAMGMDFQYSTSMDLEVRTNADYTFVKNMGSDKLPHDISWMYRYTHPSGLMSMYQNEFVCKDKWGGLYVGWFKLPPWHKAPGEDIYAKLDIKPNFLLGQAQDIVRRESMEDAVVHAEIIKALSDPQNKGSIRAVSRATNHDRDTVSKHAKLHEQKQCGCYSK